MSTYPSTPATKDAAHIEWAEKTGLENLKGRLATGDVMLAQANQLLAILIAGIGGAIALGNKIFTPAAGAAETASIATAIWLALIAALLTRQCIATRWTQVLHNEPKSLYPPVNGHSMLEIKEFELENIQVRIERTKLRNIGVAIWLDRCRYATAATPLIYAIAAYIAGR